MTNLNELAQRALNRVQTAVKDEREEIAHQLDVIGADIREAVAEEEERLQQQYEEQAVQLQDEYDQDVDQLKSLVPMQCFGEAKYRELRSKWGNVFGAGIGAEAIYDYLQDLDLDALAKELWHEVRHGTSKTRRRRATRRLRVVEGLRQSGNKPEWMILTVLPVIPPDLRPMVQLDGGRFATSDLNDLYRRVINRNNRLKRLMELSAPDVLVRNEKRMLQEAVDALIDNSRRGKARSRRGNRDLKSLSDMLKGKRGRFRRNLLGKRVDYSGRSVIVVGPKLEMHQCGLPKEMAVELYRPFVISKLVEHNQATSVKSARRVIERGRPEVWEALEDVIQSRPVLLNRAPTLHRLGIQAFEPILVEGRAIHLHPLVCAAFNADFDGDQMAVHVPLSERAVREANELMLSTRNLLKPANGEPIVGPTKDMVLGCYYLTMDENHVGVGRAFSTIEEVIMAYSLGKVHIHASIKLLNWTADPADSQGGPIETTVGRVLFNDILPEELRFVNEVQDKGTLKDLVAQAYHLVGQERTAALVDRIKDIGFQYATRSGTSIAVSDLTPPREKPAILSEAASQVSEVDRQYRRGLLTEEEQYTRTVELWSDARDKVSDAVQDAMDPDGPIYVMASSGSTKGGFGPIAQLAGMRGLMADPSGRIIKLPIRSSFREGLTALEYFISAHGARKGLADTALRTADAGYLTRRLVDVAQDIIINAEDCGTRAGFRIHRDDNDVDPNLPQMAERILGRVLAGPVRDPATGNVMFERGELLDREAVSQIEDAAIDQVFIRSPLTCQLDKGLCRQCYGRDLARNELVKLGATVGIVAAQSIGEPGTQLTLRTFHTGGVAHGGDITHGLPRVEELLEARKHPKGEALLAEIGGRVEINRLEDGTRTVKVIDSELIRDEYAVESGWKVLLDQDQEEVREGDLIAMRGADTAAGEDIAVASDVFEQAMDLDVIARSGSWYKYGEDTLAQGRENTEEVLDESPALMRQIENKVREAQGLAPLPTIEVQRAETAGRVVRDNGGIVVVHENREQREYELPSAARLLVQEGQRIESGDQLTEGTKNPRTLLQLMGRESTQQYMLQEVQKVYRSQGVNIHDKHFEVIIRKMLAKVKVTHPGDTDFLQGDLVLRGEFSRVNAEVASKGKQPASARPSLLGITKAALNTESFLSAASFQHTIKALSTAAIEGKRDELEGLKENVIIGKLIPAGTGFWEAHKDQLLDEVKENELLEGGLDAGLDNVDTDLDLALVAEGLGIESISPIDDDSVEQDDEAAD
jgi:DNA-directed RNA polymerase subunit beta'